MIEIAHKANLPLILDAAAKVPPPENLSKFVKMGADLVAFSGGKNLRGPQCSGLLMGRKNLVDAAYANSSPNNFLPRIAKVGKEEIVGLLTAVEICLKKDYASEAARVSRDARTRGRSAEGGSDGQNRVDPESRFQSFAAALGAVG